MLFIDHLTQSIDVIFGFTLLTNSFIMKVDVTIIYRNSINFVIYVKTVMNQIQSYLCAEDPALVDQA